jgi:hypothetical protein
MYSTGIITNVPTTVVSTSFVILDYDFNVSNIIVNTVSNTGFFNIEIVDTKGSNRFSKNMLAVYNFSPYNSYAVSETFEGFYRYNHKPIFKLEKGSRVIFSSADSSGSSTGLVLIGKHVDINNNPVNLTGLPARVQALL